MRVGATGVMRIVDDFLLVLLLVLFITSTVLIMMMFTVHSSRGVHALRTEITQEK
jgi:hypothetical protein